MCLFSVFACTSITTQVNDCLCYNNKMVAVNYTMGTLKSHYHLMRVISYLWPLLTSMP